MARYQNLQIFLAKNHPHIPLYTPSNPGFAELRKTYMCESPTPLAIARPQSPEDVACLVRYAVDNDIDITVRAGGHDVHGRCFVEDALAIDLRDMAYVHIDESERSAAIGGGTLAGKLATELAKCGLVTACALVPSVGHVGWSIYGGYGLVSSNYGMGVDQILGATVVNAQCEIVEADAEMLNAIRGGGGSVGIIVEMAIRVYPLEKVLAGSLIYESNDLTLLLRKFRDLYRHWKAHELHDALGLQPSVMNLPMGKYLVIGFMWSSTDFERGWQYLDEITSLENVIHNSVEATTVPQWQQAFAPFVPSQVYGSTCTVNVRELTDEVINVIGEALKSMPDDPATLISFHQLRRSAPPDDYGSVYETRIPHYCVEIIATSTIKQHTNESWDWAVCVRQALTKTESENVLRSSYIALTPPADVNSSLIFGERWEELKKIKKHYDPDNVFKHALPKFD